MGRGGGGGGGGGGRGGGGGGVHAVVPCPASVPPVMSTGMQDQFKSQIEDLRAQNKDLIAERGAAAARGKSEMATLRNQFDKYKADNSNTGRRNEIANTALAAAKTTARAAEAALAQAQLQVQQLERDLAAARLRIGGLQGGGGRPVGQTGGWGGSQFRCGRGTGRARRATATTLRRSWCATEGAGRPGRLGRRSTW